MALYRKVDVERYFDGFVARTLGRLR
jgi:hypothetical protein